MTALDTEGHWFYIRQWDNYEGWIYHFSLIDCPAQWEPSFRFGESTGWIFQEPDTHSLRLRRITAGIYLPAAVKDDHWVEVTMPDLSIGYMKRSSLTGPGADIRKSVQRTAEQFLGTSYLWGGKTAYGFDCSGFVQTVFWLNDIHLPRDAWQQAEQSRPLDSGEELRTGDLVFFTSTDKIDHVGIVCDGQRFIHCSGWTQINSLDSEAPDFHPGLAEMFSGAHRVIQD